jgi:hypothetical protein
VCVIFPAVNCPGLRPRTECVCVIFPAFNFPGLRPRTDAVFLLAFLRVRKFDQELAFENILRFYRVRREYPAIFNDLRPSSVAHALYGTRFVGSLPHRDRQGRLVTIVQPGEQLTLNTFTPSSLHSTLSCRPSQRKDSSSCCSRFSQIMQELFFSTLSSLLQRCKDVQQMARFSQNHFKIQAILTLTLPNTNPYPNPNSYDALDVIWGRGFSLVVRAADWHAGDPGSNPW